MKRKAKPKGRALGGLARARKLSPQRRSEIAKLGGLARSNAYASGKRARKPPAPPAVRVRLNERTAKALRCLQWFWGCVLAAAEIDGDTIEPGTYALHFSSHGATAIVTAEDMGTLCELARVLLPKELGP